jgi:Holliday junction resolvasome RuvABC endonuclease subunit
MIENRKVILGIDQASNCGWAINNQIYGLWDLKTRKDEDSGMKLLRFRNKLKEVVASENVDIIVYERVAGQHKSSIIHAAKLVAVIETFCIDNGIGYASFSAAEIKKYATGKGNANKEAMVTAAQQRYGYTGTDDNIADALHILNLANETYNK